MLTGRLISSTFQNAKFSYHHVSCPSDLTHLTHLTLFMSLTQMFGRQCAPVFLVGIGCRLALNFCNNFLYLFRGLGSPFSDGGMICPSLVQKTRLSDFHTIAAQ